MNFHWHKRAAAQLHQVEGYVIRRLNKVVYYVKGDTIHIAALWDTRREPKAQAANVK